MTNKETVSLSIKLAGIYCFMIALSHLSFTSMNVVSALRRGFWQIITSMASFIELLLSFTPFVLMLLLAAYLIFSNRFASRMASSIMQEEEEDTTACTLREIQMLAFSIIGIWLIVNAIPSLIQPIVRILYSRSQESRSIPFNTFLISQVIAGFSKLAFGIYLFLGGKGLVRLWQRLNSQEV